MTSREKAHQYDEVMRILKTAGPFSPVHDKDLKTNFLRLLRNLKQYKKTIEKMTKSAKLSREIRMLYQDLRLANNIDGLKDVPMREQLRERLAQATKNLRDFDLE
jgi:hypothetical protein